MIFIDFNRTLNKKHIHIRKIYWMVLPYPISMLFKRIASISLWFESHLARSWRIHKQRTLNTRPHVEVNTCKASLVSCLDLDLDQLYFYINYTPKALCLPKQTWHDFTVCIVYILASKIEQWIHKNNKESRMKDDFTDASCIRYPTRILLP